MIVVSQMIINALAYFSILAEWLIYKTTKLCDFTTIIFSPNKTHGTHITPFMWNEYLKVLFLPVMCTLTGKLSEMSFDQTDTQSYRLA